MKKRIVFLNLNLVTEQNSFLVLDCIKKELVGDIHYIAIQVISNSKRLKVEFHSVANFFGYVNNKEKNREELNSLNLINLAINSLYTNTVCLIDETRDQEVEEAFLELNFDFKKVMIEDIYFYIGILE